MRIVIIDYNTGNTGSILNMFRHLGIKAYVSGDLKDIERADKLILPGVGSFDTGMENLRMKGLVNSLNRKVLIEKTPILGICLGMQLMTKRSEEGSVHGLGWIDAETVKFSKEMIGHLRVPHMGWNSVMFQRKHPIIRDMHLGSRFYFIHSYYVKCRNAEDVLCRTSYGIEFDSLIVKENIIACQFHPEKSHKYGMQLLENFANYTYASKTSHPLLTN